MNEASVIRPEERKSKCRCCLCKIAYTPRQYKILFEAKKVIFLRLLPPNLKRPKTTCHSCLMTLIKSFSEDKETLKVKVVDDFRKKSWICSIDAVDVSLDVPNLDFFT